MEHDSFPGPWVTVVFPSQPEPEPSVVLAGLTSNKSRLVIMVGAIVLALVGVAGPAGAAVRAAADAGLGPLLGLRHDRTAGDRTRH
jgi:hypothetical protein